MAMDRVQNNNSFVGSNPGNLPPGFRFHPTDEELILHYLKKKAASNQIPVPIIAEIDLYKFDPWDLPAKAAFGEREWYFFSPRDRKYPNGARPNRAAASGYWKATGTDKPIFLTGSTQPMGVKKALVFYKGRPPKGIKTSWIMHEYRLSDSGSSTSSTVFGLRKGSMRLDDWVLCRIYKKKKSEAGIIRRERDDDVVDELAMQPQEQKPFIMPREGGFGGFNQQDSEFPVLNSFFPDENSEYTGMLNEGYPTKEQNIPSTPTLSSVDVKALDSLKRTLSLNYMDDVAPPSKRSSGGNASTSINMNFTTNSSNSQLQSQSQQIPFFLNGSQPNSYQFPQRLLMTSPSMEDFQQLFRATFAAENRQQ